MPESLGGIGVGVGIVVGPLVRMSGPPELPLPRPVGDRSTEVALAQDALATVAAELAARSAKASDSTGAEILDALSMMVGDPTLGEQVEDLICADTDAPHALHAAFEGYRELLTQAGGYMAERAQDLADLRDRAIAVALGLAMPGVPDPGHPFVLAATELSPADTAGLDTTRVLAIVTEAGGPTSHTAILARSLGVPCVVGCAGVMGVVDGTMVAVDAEAGVVEVGMVAERQDELRARGLAVAAELAAVRGPGRTADGHPVQLLRNIGSAADLDGAVSESFEGVGLFRTEFLFLDRTDPPSFDEQRSAYAAVLRAARGRKVVVRTLDAGADKPLPFLAMKPEPNPALGVRGLRVGRRMPDVLVEQLAALAAAAAEVDGAEVWVMAPMVATTGEAAWFAELARKEGLGTVGAMVEVPALALHARQVLAEVDFLSIGTNDLAQYTFAADRMDAALADLLDPWQPALLDLIARCAGAGQALGKPVGICGEAAADPRLAPVLVGLGVTSLSMAGPAIPLVSRSLASHSLADCQNLAQLALSATSPEAARQAAR
ncbi:MAG TPA: phosphoenolpyruvate--protein phosphotransferase [Acidimicrobiales bacterium]|jgi:phosphotransferase system enzyme I (PtsI)